MAKTGRPATYDAQELSDRLNAYIDSSDFPTLPAFCSERYNPSKDTLYRLAKDNEDLSDALKRLVCKQEAKLVSGEYKHPVLAIFLLKQKQHGYQDKQEVDVSSRIVYDLPDQVKLLTDGD